MNLEREKMDGIPNFNIFIMNTPRAEEKPKKKLTNALRENAQQMQMLEELKRITAEVKGLPHVAHAGGG